jgi:hypothetical protein
MTEGAKGFSLPFISKLTNQTERRTKMSRTRSFIACAALAGSTLFAIALPAAAGAVTQESPTGAPTSAQVRMTSLMGVPPEGYSLTCTGLAACTSSGNIDLETEAEVDAVFTKRSGRTFGQGPLDYSSTEGTVQRSYTCEGEEDPFVSQVGVTGTSPGQLEVAEVKAQAGTNSLAVAINHGGVTGDSFPQEHIERSDGGCGTPTQDLDQTMGQWYYHFYLAHQPEQQPTSNDLEIRDLVWKNGVFTKTYERVINVGFGSNRYPLFESTTIEVEPDYCEGKEHKIVSATAKGESLGLDGMQFYPGQIVNVPAGAKIRLGDSSKIEVDDATSFQITDCETSKTKIFLKEDVGSLWIHVKRAVAGSDRKFDVVTERAVAGVRGTIFEVSYDKDKELTKVAVEESSVYLKGHNGAKGKVIIKEGQTGVQKGKKKPKLLKKKK